MAARVPLRHGAAQGAIGSSAGLRRTNATWAACRRGAGRLNPDNALVVVAAQEGVGIGRIRMRRAIDDSAKSPIPFVQDSAEPATIIHTDKWSSYLPREGGRKGYEHEITISTRKKQAASQSSAASPPRDHAPRALADAHSDSTGDDQKEANKLFFRPRAASGRSQTGAPGPHSLP
ncbi:MAG: transposase [Bryobacterales bacterium]|nr:transposase [Bryobacterales bacterium]